MCSGACRAAPPNGRSKSALSTPRLSATVICTVYVPAAPDRLENAVGEPKTRMFCTVSLRDSGLAEDFPQGTSLIWRLSAAACQACPNGFSTTMRRHETSVED